ncbi:hypothetical protein E3N88_14448 [Mikania micrantha]|uniref:Uncharacterized protein n=1 Tax=Mikania micrantha TaxID=192012 RepID=A0A5N6P2R0_9ASTR|nr:hypothetical protein E3N88_14448 [Mikania micrantha]
MPPATMTVTTDTRKLPRPGRGGVISQGLTEEESRVRAIAEIVNNMVELSRNGENVDLNALKSAACRNSDSELQVRNIGCVYNIRCLSRGSKVTASANKTRCEKFNPLNV